MMTTITLEQSTRRQQNMSICGCLKSTGDEGNARNPYQSISESNENQQEGVIE
jgi:hypothetical protein